LSAALIATNWCVFIWAVTSGRVLESSLGYYITPLINMAAGVVLFRERMDKIGMAAIALAVLGVAIQAVALGELPWVSLVLGFSFGAYGIVRKQMTADAQTGLFIECLFLAIPSLVYAIWLANQGQGHFGATTQATLWLIAAGPITAAPLVLFSWAARRIPLSAMGFLQFIAPTMSFAIGVLQGEAFTPLRAVSFAFIWGGAAVFAWGAWTRSRTMARAAAEAAEAAAGA
jgi:chloramphenicol-sensitive protein RarD